MVYNNSMFNFVLWLLTASLSYASTETIIKNYPFAPDRKYPPITQVREKPQIDKVPIVGYIVYGGQSYIIVREEGKLKKVGSGDEFMGVRILGVGRGFVIVRDSEGIRRLKISWEKTTSPQKPPAQTETGVQKPPKQLMELLQEGR